MRTIKHKKIEILNGASVCVLHGSPQYKEAPYMKDNKGNQMNRLAYINFLRSEKEEDETNKEHFIRDKEVFDHMLKQLVNKFSMYQTYILPSITKTSKAITIN